MSSGNKKETKKTYKGLTNTGKLKDRVRIESPKTDKFDGTLWNKLFKNEETKATLKGKVKRSIVVDIDEKIHKTKKTASTFKFHGSTGWKLLHWIARARAAVKIQRYSAIRHNIEDLVDHQVLNPVVVKNEGEDMPMSILFEVNQDTYTNTSLQQRDNLKNNKPILFYILCWWEGMRKDVKKNAIGEEDYKQMSRCIYEILVPDGTEEHLHSVLDKDWKHDRNDAMDMLDILNFVSAIFELTDVWTESITVEEYVEFIKAMHERVAALAQKKGLSFIKPYEEYAYDPNDEDLLDYLNLRDLETKRTKTKCTKKKKKKRKTLDVDDFKGKMKMMNMHNFVQRMLKLRGLNSPYIRKSYKEKLLSVFHMVDKDADGYLTVKEFQAMFRVLGFHFSTRLVNHFISEIDSDQDGRVSINEFFSSIVDPNVQEQINAEEAELERYFDDSDDEEGEYELESQLTIDVPPSKKGATKSPKRKSPKTRNSVTTTKSKSPKSRSPKSKSTKTKSPKSKGTFVLKGKRAFE